jgi:hypothetical protein
MKLFGFEITRTKSKGTELAKAGTVSRQENVKKKLIEGIREIKEKELKYSNYRLQKITNVSINTIKKYKDFINQELEK